MRELEASLGETGWDVEGAAEPPGGTRQVPPCTGREGAKRQEGRPPSAPHSLLPVLGLPLPLGFRGLQLPSPIPGSTLSHLKQAKHRQRCPKAGREREQEYAFGQEGPPKAPLLGGAPSLAHPTAATPHCGACYPSSHLLEILRVAEFLDGDRQEVAGDIGDNHVGAG